MTIRRNLIYNLQETASENVIWVLGHDADDGLSSQLRIRRLLPIQYCRVLIQIIIALLLQLIIKIDSELPALVRY